MLDVIITRGLPLDRVTTTDVWATDTIPAELPPVLEAKARIEEKLWQMYRINVDHLCARNKDGSKKTYEQMFYHVPVRRSQSVQVERERDGLRPGDPKIPKARNHYRLSAKHWIQLLPETQGLRTARSRDFHWQRESPGVRSSRVFGCRIQGFPAQISPWCRKLKIDKVKTPPLQ